MSNLPDILGEVREKKVSRRKNRSRGNEASNTVNWGRVSATDPFTGLRVGFLLLLCTMTAFYFVLAIHQHNGVLLGPLIEIFMLKKLDAAKAFIVSWKPFSMYTFWYFLQVFLDRVLPGKIGFGQLTPGGNLLPYKINGLSSWIVSHALFLLGVWSGFINGGIVYDNFIGLLAVANVWGYLLAAFAYVKACYFPSHPEDSKWTGSWIYDFVMGVEMNPRIGGFDFKLFHNGRPGLIAWTLINLSYAFKQYESYGYVTNSMIVVNILQAIYVLDFFWNEDWYLRTIDIAHEHFGWYLSWGDTVWVPVMYTLQGHYLVVNPVQLPNLYALAVLAMGLIGYWLFRTVNHQKDLFRTSEGRCLIWGSKPTFIKTQFKTADGNTRSSLLLTSGFWGISRHFNYVGDLIMATSYCLACGFGHFLPHFYSFYMVALLVHRIYRDEHRLSAKYGKYWSQYCEVVPWRIMPYIF